MPRYAAKTDATEPEVLEAIERAGWKYWRIRVPCDLMCWHPGHDIWQPIEVKPLVGKRNPKARVRTDQPQQTEFLRETGTPVVATAEEALLALARRIDRHLGLVAKEVETA